MNKFWIIFSYEHNRWWAPNSRGYVPLPEAAGHYTENDAREIIQGANSFGKINEIAIEVEGDIDHPTGKVLMSPEFRED